MSDRKRKRQAGVTLIEMLVVVTIIALFAALVGRNIFRQTDKARVTAARAQIEIFMGALGQYKLDTGTLPTTEQGLHALWTRPSDVQTWDGPYLAKEIPPDPWGNQYVYTFPGQHGDMPDVISYGADGQPGGEGFNADILSWKSH
ncbi:MAG: type II secretion system major pseudopilin GspG [Bryobacteraceae bacterium]